MTVHILRCISTRARHPQVLAFVDGWQVRWTPTDGWGCACGGQGRPHLSTVQGVLDPRVTGASPDWGPPTTGGSDGRPGLPVAEGVPGSAEGSVRGVA